MHHDHDGKGCCGMKGSHIYWWASLVVAVLAVPSIGFIIASIVPGKGLGQIVVFVLTCWVSTFLGMRLMKK